MWSEEKAKHFWFLKVCPVGNWLRLTKIKAAHPFMT